MTQAIIDIPVIYQDHHLLIVNKPAGLVIHPTYKHADGTMWDSILAYLAEQGDDGWQPEELPDKPEWAGEEVTHDLRYLNSNLIKRPYRAWT